ncbi:putative phosphatidylethanolamine-binding protein [Lyophyllum shimeji]|uniref:Phosphatidylethanolamine-binding protein n=1 Tax=Lyophyllum shimeji TaxID=47721 RepID=A0A9P3PJY6_LYOSH|nr:putative phosphatidylethanolamine-binding protein [Lyophyllum shimeji]
MDPAGPLSNVVTALQREAIIPEVIPPTFFPSILFSIVWPNGKEAVLSNVDYLTREDTLAEPDVTFVPLTISADISKPAQDTTYTLAMTDPDAPSRAEPKYRQFRHWVITGLKIPVSGAQNPSALKTKPSTTPYRPPGPPPGSGVHRYTFLLFEEPAGGFTVPEGAPEYGSALEERRSWNALDFGNRYGLQLVGANFFLVQAAAAA